MVMPDRKYNGPNYRFGFNGKENDNDVKGFGNQQDYGMRIHDTRLGRFLSVDPIGANYPELNPYQFASNSPLAGIDLNGGEFKYYSTQWRLDPVLINAESGKILSWEATRLKLSNKVMQSDKDLARVTIDNGVSTFSFTLSMTDLGISAKVVNIKGVARVLPTNMNEDDLPSPDDDDFWSGLETEDEYLGRIKKKVVETGNTIASVPIIGGRRAVTRKITQAVTQASKPLQRHHFIPWQNKMTKQYEKITKKYGLDLDDGWNKELLSHQGGHTKKYRQWILERLRKADLEAKGDKKIFQDKVEQYIKKPVRDDPSILYKEGEHKLKL